MGKAYFVCHHLTGNTQNADCCPEKRGALKLLLA